MSLHCICEYRERSGSKNHTKDTFLTGTIQASNTLLGQEHFASHSTNHSSWSRMKIANKNEATLIPKQSRYLNKKKGGVRNRIVSIKPKDKGGECGFSLNIFLSRKDSRWYLSWDNARANWSSPPCHTNHFPIDPSHVSISQRKHLSDECRKLVESHLINGMSVETIIKVVYLRFKINLRTAVVKNMRKEILDEMSFLEDNHETNPSSAAQKVVNLLKKSENVSYIILKHHITSGFVTYTKQQGEGTRISMDSNTLLEVECWRRDLKMDDSEEILVSVAWCHDEERRKVEMFPEYLSFDTTFGLNKLRRSLFLAVGTDGYNKVFVAFRAWMPSKQKSAFYWTIAQAMPHLFGTSLCGKHKVISSDSELSLVEAIKGAINTPNSHFANAKFRSDYFHFFELRWKKLIGLIDNRKSEYISSVGYIKYWIKTWFNLIETEKEFQTSFSELEYFIQEKATVLGETFIIEVKKILHTIMSAKVDLLHYEFRKKTTFGFLGSSIVESMNSSIKKSGLFSIEGTMTLSHSTLMQIKQTEMRSEKRNIELASSINTTHRYIKIDIDKYLTKYMVDIAAKNFDSRLLYYVRKISSFEYWVMRKTIHDDTEGSCNASPVTKFDKVHVVSIDGQFISCSCGYVNQYMCPCRHVMAVLKEEHNINYTLFHYRWWKQYDYFYLKNFTENSIMDDPTIVSLCKKLKAWITFTVSNGFYGNGEYKGCYLENNVVDELKIMELQDDEVHDTMKKLVYYTMDVGPVIRHSRVFNDPPVVHNEVDGNPPSQFNDLLPQEMNMTMESHISQNWTQEDSNDEEGCGNDDEGQISHDNLTERGSDVWNRTMDVLECIQTKEDADDFHKLLIHFKSKLNGRNSRGNDCSVIGAQRANVRSLKRKRFKQFWEHGKGSGK